MHGMETVNVATPAFRSLLSDANHGAIVLPVLNANLFEPDPKVFTRFTVPIRGWSNRKPDGWFHASEHPMWPARMLYYYLTAPERLVVRPFDADGAITVTMGVFVEEFFGHILTQAGLLTQRNVALSDPVTGACGETDGIIGSHPYTGYECKSIHAGLLKRFPDTRVDDPALIAALKKIKPKYYAQAQEYMRISDGKLRKIVMILAATITPFPRREIHIPYDEVFAYDVKRRYLAVRQAVKAQTLPEPCCGPKTEQAKTCPARAVCPVGMM